MILFLFRIYLEKCEFIWNWFFRRELINFNNKEKGVLDRNKIEEIFNVFSSVINFIVNF